MIERIQGTFSLVLACIVELTAAIQGGGTGPTGPEGPEGPTGPTGLQGNTLEETVGTTGTYATIDAAITAFAAGTWGDGVSLRIQLVDAGAQSTAWAGLPATVQCLILTTCVRPGATVTVTAAFPGDVYLSGPLTVDVDTTHLCERTTEPTVYIEVDQDALVTSTTMIGTYDVGRGSSTTQIVALNDATISQCRFFSANTAGFPSSGVIFIYGGRLFGALTVAGTGTGSASTTIQGHGGSIGGTLLDLNGKLVGTQILQDNISGTDALTLSGGNYIGVTHTLSRGAGGTSFVYNLNASCTNTSFGVFNFGGVAGTMTLNGGGSANFVDCTLPRSLGLGVLSTGVGMTVESIVRCGITDIQTVDIVASGIIEDFTITSMTGDLDLNGATITRFEFNPSGAALTYNVGSTTTVFEGLETDLSSASGYQLTVLGQTIRNLQIIDPDPGALGHSIGGILVSGPQANLVENVYFRSSRGGVVPIDITTVNLIGFSARQAAFLDSTFDVSVSAMNLQKMVIIGDLSVFFTEVLAPGGGPHHGVLDSTQVTGTTSVTAGTALALVHQISNCLFIGAASLDGGIGTNDLHLSNTRFVAGPTIGSGGAPGYSRAVVSTSISDVVTVVVATAKAIGTGNIGIA